jgi:hypothetical protein
MATKGKTRGPEENKHVKKDEKQDPKFQTRDKQEEKEIGKKKK